MKRILITGANSYIGTSFQNYLAEPQFKGKYQVTTIDMIGDSWKSHDFSQYDSVYHVAGIAHSDSGNISEERAKLYYAVNTNLTLACAQKAKDSGVKQFLFMSSAIVYGDSAPIGKAKVITRETPVSPANCYSDSKVQAEFGLHMLECETFKVVILRPPMIFGKNSKGNYPLLSKLARRLPVFPKIKNQRSMLYIGNLVEFVRLMIENDEQGIFWPQNSQYSNTSDVIAKIAKAHNRRCLLVPGFGLALKLLSHVTCLVNKAFGNLSYDQEMSKYKEDYQKYTLEEAIQRTEK